MCIDSQRRCTHTHTHQLTFPQIFRTCLDSSSVPMYKLSTRRFIIRRSSFSQWSCKTEGTTDRGKDRSAFECSIEKECCLLLILIEISMPVRAYVGVSRCCAVAPPPSSFLRQCVRAYARSTRKAAGMHTLGNAIEKMCVRIYG